MPLKAIVLVFSFVVLAPGAGWTQGEDTTSHSVHGLIEDRVEELENSVLLERIQQLENHLAQLKKSSVQVVVDWKLLSPFALLISILFIIFWLRRPLNKILLQFANNIGKSNIEIFGIKMSANQVEHIIIDREILRIGISIAFSDGEFNQVEGEHLRERATAMHMNYENLSIYAKKIILQEAIEMALADNDFHENELKKIYLEAQIQGYEIEKINQMIFMQCKERKVTPPKSLESVYQAFIENGV